MIATLLLMIAALTPAHAGERNAPVKPLPIELYSDFI